MAWRSSASGEAHLDSLAECVKVGVKAGHLHIEHVVADRLEGGEERGEVSEVLRDGEREVRTLVAAHLRGESRAGAVHKRRARGGARGEQDGA